MKKYLALVLALVMSLSLFACGKEETPAEDGGETPALKIGVILLHDESIGYDYAHIMGIEDACTNLGIDSKDSNQVIWKYNVGEDESCYDAACDLADNGCNVIISDSYGHQSYMNQAAEEYPNVTFLIATGDTANVATMKNTRNFFTHTYESRYVSGVVAGLKIQEMIDSGVLTDANYNADGTVKTGYVGAYPYAEVVSGYTAFYLGMKSVVENVSMDVSFTNAWADPTAEQQAAEALLAAGCCIISQHADSTGGPSAIEAAVAKGAVCYYVGYNIDMLTVAPTAILTSAQNNWAVYYNYALGLAQQGKCDEIAYDWSEGYATGANMISALGESCADGTAEKVAEVEAAIKDGSLKVFDTATFTVSDPGDGVTVDADGHVTSCTFNSSTMTSDYSAVLYEGQDYEAIEDGAFVESVFRSAPYFSLMIDGINAMI